MHIDIYKNRNYVHAKSDRKENFPVHEIKIIFNCVNLINLFLGDILCVLQTHQGDEHLEVKYVRAVFLSLLFL